MSDRAAEHTAVPTWKDVVDAEVGKVFIDRFDEGLRFIVLRGPAALCAYVGVPLSHPLAGHSYEDLPIECHGGLTYANSGGGDRSFLPADFFWYGWDYAHCYDKSTYDGVGREGKEWLSQDVDAEAWTPLYQFRKLMRVAEAIAKTPTAHDSLLAANARLRQALARLIEFARIDHNATHQAMDCEFCQAEALLKEVSA